MQHSPGFLKLVESVKKGIRQTDIATVKKRLENGEKFHFVDVREDTEWDQGHCRGAIHIGKGVIERDIEEEIPDQNAEIILYCGGGYRSSLATDSLQKMGYKNVFSMDGGYRAWKAAGYPTESDMGF